MSCPVLAFLPWFTHSKPSPFGKQFCEANTAVFPSHITLSPGPLRRMQLSNAYTLRRVYSAFPFCHGSPVLSVLLLLFCMCLIIWLLVPSILSQLPSPDCPVLAAREFCLHIFLKHFFAYVHVRFHISFIFMIVFESLAMFMLLCIFIFVSVFMFGSLL